MTDIGTHAGDIDFGKLRDSIMPFMKEKIPASLAQETPRAEIARIAKATVGEYLSTKKVDLTLLDQRDLVTSLINRFVAETGKPKPSPARPSAEAPTEKAPEQIQNSASASPYAHNASRASVDQAKLTLQPLVLDRIDTSLAASLPREALSRDLSGLIAELLNETKIQLNAVERAELVKELLDDMLGLGPLEPLLADEAVSEIMVNGAKQVFTESHGKLTLSDVQFRDNAHVMGIATRIVTAIGRRIDESSPLCDARLADGSRVNIIIPPLALDGAVITIRKFAKKKITLDTMLKFGSLSPTMAKVLRIAGRSRLNILISGGTGSGKTTLLNALSQMIDHGERIVTIEDAAELQLQQPHVVRLETRPANLEGQRGSHHARPCQKRFAYAPRPHYCRRNARRRGPGHAASDEHRP
jgi:pilus assembly protein CpaF